MSRLPPTYTPSSARTNTLAVVSLIAGAFSVLGHFVVPGIGGGTLALVAIVTGFIARGEIRRSGEQGMWMATVGIVLGIIHWTLLILIFLALILAVFVFGGIALLHH
ncbi:MAG TPA: DUF4190 domain-containing protein [Candidatus Dormibacteraeota bacterium]|nr:DUF4190 domain-containing protein [Candidatus Dormibacteraeota bacterium]